MGRTTVALSLDESIYEKYQKCCKENHMIQSHKIQAIMKKELEEKKNV